jgi:hypothetical protein
MQKFGTENARLYNKRYMIKLTLILLLLLRVHVLVDGDWRQYVIGRFVIDGETRGL